MKKILIILAVLLLPASACFAAVTTSADNSGIDWAATGLALHGGDATNGASATSALIGKTSTGVSVAWQTSTQGYALMTEHKNGTKAYGTSYDSTSIYQTVVDITPGASVYAYNGGALTKSDTTDFKDTTKWKSM